MSALKCGCHSIYRYGPSLYGPSLYGPRFGGRVCHGPSLSRAEFVMGRVCPRCPGIDGLTFLARGGGGGLGGALFFAVYRCTNKGLLNIP